jgi:arylsulfatase A-like enzyme
MICAFIAVILARVAQGTVPPNVVVYMMDDMQFIFDEAPATTKSAPYLPDASVIPHMQSIRDNGAIFLQANVASTMCSPSRFNMLTGRYCSRAAYARSPTFSTMSDTSGSSRNQVLVPPCKLTDSDQVQNLQTALSNFGYATIHSGKWHLTPEKEVTYDDNYSLAESAVKASGFTDVASVYIQNMEDTDNLPFSHNLEWTTATAQAAITKAVDASQPFFLYYAPTTPHSPNNEEALALSMTSTPAGELVDAPVSGMPARDTVLSRALKKGPNKDTSIGTIWGDDALGAIVAHLDSLGVLDNTIIIVTMDHGMEAKRDLFEGGMRVALMVSGPGVTPGAKIPYPVSNIDLTPTILEAVGASDTVGFHIDGVSWWGAVTEAGPSAALLERDCLISEIDYDRAIKCFTSAGGNVKYVSHWSTDDSPQVHPHVNDDDQLYDIVLDPTEQTNVFTSSAYAAMRDVMMSDLTAHDLSTFAYLSQAPSASPFLSPSTPFTMAPTAVPQTTSAPSQTESTHSPSTPPTIAPTASTTTTAPSGAPTISPIMTPSKLPTVSPTAMPIVGPTPAPTRSADKPKPQKNLIIKHLRVNPQVNAKKIFGY